MRILNLTTTARMIALGNKDIILKPRSLSIEFDPTDRLVESIITTEDYQNKYRVIMDASEKSRFSNRPMVPGVIITPEKAQILEKNMESKIFPPKIDIFGNPMEPEKTPDPEPEVGDPEVEASMEDDPEEESTLKEKKTPEFGWDSDKKDVKLREINKDTKFRTLNNPEHLVVVYKSSNTEVANIDEKGNVEVRKRGTAMIVAISVETEEFISVQSEYKLTVK